jgi:hypothetical protein
MLQILKKEGRLSADEIKPGSNCYRIRKVHPHTLTYFHARLGYRVGASTVSRPTCTAERFWELNPVKYEAGWPQDGRRHTCLDFYFYATDKDSGSTAGYAGHLTTEFFRNYKGKLIEQNIAAAVARYYRLMPDKYRHLETAKDEKGEYIIKLPAWYQIKDESELDNKIDALAVTLADLNLINYSLKPGCSAIPLNEFRMIENSWRVHYADENGKPAYKTLHKKPAVAALARKFKVVPDDQLITFPIEDAALKFVNGYKIEPWAWRIEGYVLINGVRTWLRPVRTNKQEAESLLAELRKLYPSEGGRSGA